MQGTAPLARMNRPFGPGNATRPKVLVQPLQGEKEMDLGMLENQLAKPVFSSRCYRQKGIA